MSKDAEMIRAMTVAGVPRSCWGISCTGTGRAPLRDFAVSTTTARQDREALTFLVIYNCNSENNPELELAAKELVIAGRPTRYVPFNKLQRDLRMQESRSDLESYLDTIQGRGALVVPDIPPAPRDSSSRDYDEAIAFLVAHVYDGGTLVTNLPTRAQAALPAWPTELKALVKRGSDTREAIPCPRA